MPSDPPRRLHDIAHARAGDKGDALNVAVFVHDPADYPALLATATEARVADLFAFRGVHDVTRYELPNLHGVNIVLDGVLGGGVNENLYLDRHGKTLSSLLLTLRLT